MVFQETSRKPWKKFPPFGALILCLTYATFASFLLTKIVPVFGELDTSWPHHGVFHRWDIIWQSVIILASIVVLATSAIAAIGGRKGRFWLSFSLATLVTLLLIHGPHYSFLDYHLQSGSFPPLRTTLNILWFHLSSMSYGLLVIACVSLAHFWLFFSTASARRYFARPGDA